MSRRIEKLPAHVYFVIGGPFARYDGATYETVDGPYSTLSAAKGKRTSKATYTPKDQKAERLAKYRIIESPTGEWKEVEL